VSEVEGEDSEEDLDVAGSLRQNVQMGSGAGNRFRASSGVGNLSGSGFRKGGLNSGIRGSGNGVRGLLRNKGVQGNKKNGFTSGNGFGGGNQGMSGIGFTSGWGNQANSGMTGYGSGNENIGGGWQGSGTVTGNAGNGYAGSGSGKIGGNWQGSGGRVPGNGYGLSSLGGQDRLFTSFLGPQSVLNINKGTPPIGNGYIHPLSGPSQAAYQVRPGIISPRDDGSLLDLINVSYEPFVLILAAVGAVLSFLLYQVIQTKGRRRGVRRAAGRNTNVEELTHVVVRGMGEIQNKFNGNKKEI